MKANDGTESTVTKAVYNRRDLRVAAAIIAAAILGEPFVSNWASPYGQCVRAVKAAQNKPVEVAAVRARHPGAYDDLDDATLARALAAKARAEAEGPDHAITAIRWCLREGAS